MSRQAIASEVTPAADGLDEVLLISFLRLRTFGFGSPIALAGYMQRILVEERHWVSGARISGRSRARATLALPTRGANSQAQGRLYGR